MGLRFARTTVIFFKRHDIGKKPRFSAGLFWVPQIANVLLGGVALPFSGKRFPGSAIHHRN